MKNRQFSSKLWFVSITFSVLITSCSGKKKAVEMESKDMDSAFKTDTVHLRNFEKELQFTGQVSFDQKQVGKVYSMISGNVTEVNAELGSFVKKGQTLAKIQSADVSQFLKDYNTAKANYDIAKRNADNTEALYKTKFSSETDLTNARKQLEIANSELDRSSQVLKLYGEGQSGHTQNGQPSFTIKAPVSGYVVERTINPNMQIRSDNGNSIFTISNLSDVWVLINIYESDIDAVKTGQSVNITTLAYPGKIFQGVIQNISQVLDNDSKVLQARVVLPNPGNLLKPDMFCTIRMTAGKEIYGKTVKMLAVNPKAVIFSQDKYFVIQDNGKGKYTTVPVEVIRSTSKYSFVRGNLKEGDLIVTEGALLLFNELNN